jgi:hypothetical protein
VDEVLQVELGDGTRAGAGVDQYANDRPVTQPDYVGDYFVVGFLLRGNSSD